MSILKVFSLVTLAIAFAACSSAEGLDEVGSETISEETEAIGQACSPLPSGPLPLCASQAEYCNVGNKCGPVGACASKPAICVDVLAPVCGCDGKTYRNSCYAARAGMSVKKQGACIGI